MNASRAQRVVPTALCDHEEPSIKPRAACSVEPTRKSTLQLLGGHARFSRAGNAAWVHLVSKRQRFAHDHTVIVATRQPIDLNEREALMGVKIARVERDRWRIEREFRKLTHSSPRRRHLQHRSTNSATLVFRGNCELMKTRDVRIAVVRDLRERIVRLQGQRTNDPAVRYREQAVASFHPLTSRRGRLVDTQAVRSEAGHWSEGAL